MLLVLIIISYLIVKPLLLAIFLGALLAYTFYPIYKWGKKRCKSGTLVALALCVIILILIIIPSIFFLKGVVSESYSLYVLGKQKLSVDLLKGCDNYFCNKIKEVWEKPETKYFLQEGLKAVTNWVIKKGTDFLASIPKFLMSLFIMLFTLFYFLKEGEELVRKAGDYLSMEKKQYAELIGRLKEIVKAIVYGYLLVALIQGALGAIGFVIFGVPSPLFWGIMMGFLALIPYIGTGLIWGPAALLIFLDGVFNNSNWLIYKGIGLFLYGLILVSSIDNLIKPKIIGEKAKIHSGVIMVGILGGIFLIGPLGVIVGPLVLSMTIVLFNVYFKKQE